MAVTVGGTSITFNDGTVQSTAAGAVTTAAVLNATAGATLGAVGTYAYLSRPAYSNTESIPGTNYAGSSFRYAGSISAINPATSSYSISSSGPSGTWKCMGLAASSVVTDPYSGTLSREMGTLFLRIS